MVVLVERDRGAIVDKPEQIGQHASVVRLVEIAVAEDEGVGQHDDLPGAEFLDVCEGQAARAAKDRHLLRRDVERLRQVSAGHGGHTIQRGIGILDSALQQAAKPGDGEDAIKLGVALLGRIDQHAAPPHPVRRPVRIVGGIRTRRSEHEHQAA